jgi:hypothetical protein
MEDRAMAQQPPTWNYPQDDPTIPTTPAIPGPSTQQPAPRPTPQAYRFGGLVLAILSLLEFGAWWFSFAGAIGNVAVYNLALTVLIVLGFALFAIDWSGYTSLCGLISW